MYYQLNMNRKLQPHSNMFSGYIL